MRRNLPALLALLGWALVSAACSSFSSNPRKDAGGGGTAGAGSGGAGGVQVDAGGGGSGGSGGAQVDAAPDAPMSTDGPGADTPADVALPCIPDGGDASGDCCPDDPLKGQPGACGCGTPDDDSDYDGTPDCHDMCPGDPDKIAPGACGCFIADTDTDHDGTADCNDRCPANPARQTSGLCGCALPDTAAPYCLAHRYSFNDGTAAATTTTVVDSVGTANGTAVNVMLGGTGSLTLAGAQTDQYVSLPARMISSLGNSATFEAWITWTGGGPWQRVFDFGASDATTPAGQGIGTSFVFFTPLSGANVSLLSVNTVGLSEVMGTAGFPLGLDAQQKPHHLACVIDGTPDGDGGAGTTSVYIDGTLVQRVPLMSILSGLNDANNWLGRSQFVLDPEFSGTYYEFRIHSNALTQQQISASAAAGPDALP